MSAAAEEIAIALHSGETLPALVAEADTEHPAGSIVVVGDIGGARREFTDMIAGELAAAGYDAIVPEFFFRQGPLTERTHNEVVKRRARLDDVRAIEDLTTAIDWLRTRARFGGSRIGTVGFCLGGTFVLNLAAARNDLATVCYYGFPGETPLRAAHQGPYPRDEIDALNGPVLAFWGDQDERAGQENIRAYIDAVTARGIEFEATVYRGLDHAFLMTEWEPDAAGHAAAMQSWQRALEFLRAHL